MVSGKFGGKPTIQDVHENKRKSASWRLRVQTNAHAKWMMDDQNINHTNSEQSGLGSKEASVSSGKLIGFDSSSSVTWVVTQMQVEVDCYPTWGDVVQAIEPRLTISGKHGVRCEWLFCDNKTSEILVRASSNMVMMNISTRRLSKFSDEIRARLDPLVVDSPPVVVKDTRILPKLDETTADHVCSGLMPRWSDLDLNEHVSHVKYVGWIIESVPESIVKNYELASMTLEYHRECGRECIFQSLTSVLRNDNGHVECYHMLRLEDGGGVIMKGWTRWHPKYQTS
ncbi:palmitoyl-acyl carrier protein thioesterase, chloroplastic-like [Bidens hawaiensis]|uniref:palmitoyl-acyl carrier protein thioesterase, chloroplastic-like n=1 Tax=Bidens hawaiensis TaxID=980011 RepID=UPI00404B3929